MNEIKRRLDEELKDVAFELDREKLEEEYKAYKRRRRSLLMSAASFVIVIGLVAALLLSGKPSGEQTSLAVDATEQNAHSFTLTASAAEVSAEYLESLTEEEMGFLLTAGGVKINVDHIYRDGVPVANTFRISGNTPIIAYGEGIERLVFHSDNASFYYPDTGRQVNNYTVGYDSEYAPTLYWLIPEAFNQWCEEMNEEGRGAEVDFSLLPRDRVTVTAVFSDGFMMTRELSLWFNDYGYLVVQDEDGTVYNDYSDVGEHEPFSEDSGVITYDNVERIVVTLNDAGRSEIEVANIDPFITALNNMKLYEELPMTWISDDATSVRVELSDGSAHTVKAAMYCVRIDGDGTVYRADYDSVDELLSLCYGLLEQNKPGSAVYGDYD